jgi:4-hydroxybenzoate polyprenyltransferase
MITTSDILLFIACLIGASALLRALADRELSRWGKWAAMFLMFIALFLAFGAGYRAGVIG